MGLVNYSIKKKKHTKGVALKETMKQNSKILSLCASLCDFPPNIKGFLVHPLTTFDGNQCFWRNPYFKCMHKKEATNQFSCFSPGFHVSLTADAATRFAAHLSAVLLR